MTKAGYIWLLVESFETPLVAAFVTIIHVLAVESI